MSVILTLLEFTMGLLQTLALASLHDAPARAARVRLSDDAISRYADLLRDAAQLPPVRALRDLLDEALAAHDNDALDPVRLGQARVRAHAVQRIIDHFLPDDDHALALSSRVETVHGQRFLLLLDFACPVGEEQLADVVRACQVNGWRGAVMASGSSYHFLGFEPMEFGAWVAAMGRALLLSGLIDVRYMGHALARGAGALRLHACEAKPTMPRVVALVGGRP